jgi:hypothetical protein
LGNCHVIYAKPVIYGVRQQLWRDVAADAICVIYEKDVI